MKYGDKSEFVRKMDEIFSHIKIDKDLMLSVEHFKIDWISRHNHTEFLSGPYIGVVPIKFTKEDENTFFIDLFRVDVRSYRKKLKQISTLDFNRTVATNPLYLLAVYFMYKTYQSNLSTKDKETFVKNLGLIITYKMMTSLLYRRFSEFDLPIDIAKLAHERLSNRFIIKEVGNWNNYFNRRVEDLTPNNTIYKKFLKFNGESAMIIIADLQSRIRSNVNHVMSVIEDVRLNKDSIKTISHLVEDSDGIGIGDISRNMDNLIDNMIHISSNPQDLINDDLVQSLVYFNPGFDTEAFKDILIEFSKDAVKNNEEVITIIEESLSYSLRYIMKKEGNVVPDLTVLFESIKNYWSNSRTSPRGAVLLKKKAFDYVKKHHRRKTKHIVGNTSIMMIIYLFIRAIISRKN